MCGETKQRGKPNLHGASRFVSEPCLWFRHHGLPRSPSDNLGSLISDSQPDFESFHSLGDQVINVIKGFPERVLYTDYTYLES